MILAMLSNAMNNNKKINVFYDYDPDNSTLPNRLFLTVLVVK